jgi:hypothetical protein
MPKETSDGSDRISARSPAPRQKSAPMLSLSFALASA